MRMIGHQVLRSIGDSTSRVLPIESNGDRYQINFESDFAFNPDDLSAIVDSVLSETAIASDYIVEILSCENDLVVHGYEKSSEVGSDILACRGRDQPMGCYSLLITVLNYDLPNEIYNSDSTDLTSKAITADSEENTELLILLVLLAFVASGMFLFFRKRNSSSATSSNTVAIGDFRFDKTRMELSLKDEKIELTSKEGALLELLYESANDTVERDTILKMVWDDEGDYVGRTLDVFISKLRKKLEADSNVKIANIRGVGYKLILSA